MLLPSLHFELNSSSEGTTNIVTDILFKKVETVEACNLLLVNVKKAIISSCKMCTKVYQSCFETNLKLNDAISSNNHVVALLFNENISLYQSSDLGLATQTCDESLNKLKSLGLIGQCLTDLYVISRLLEHGNNFILAITSKNLIFFDFLVNEYKNLLSITFATFIFGLLIFLTKFLHGDYSADNLIGVQKLHKGNTPRIGGICIVFGFIFAFNLTNEEVKPFIAVLIFGGFPAFIFGFAEDITKTLQPQIRLLATLSSGLVAYWISGYSLSLQGLWGAEFIMRLPYLSIAFTIFAVAGVCNAINIIDGLNGLSGFTSIYAAVALSVIAWQVGDVELVYVGLILGSVFLGFLLINWPFGKVFLGDGGSYFIGFTLAWLSVMLLERNANVSPFTPLLICAHPIVEVLYSMYRRHRLTLSVTEPDLGHFHSYFAIYFVKRWFYKLSIVMQNSLAGFLASLMTLTCGFLANFIYSSHLSSSLVFFAFVLSFIFFYKKMESNGMRLNKTAVRKKVIG